jgi:hypothetical protein
VGVLEYGQKFNFFILFMRKENDTRKNNSCLPRYFLLAIFNIFANQEFINDKEELA